MDLAAPPGACRIGDFEFDPAAFRLTRGGAPVHVEPKALDVLHYLLAHSGQVVSKQDLIHAVWKDTAVGDNALTRVVAHLRKVLEDPVERPRYIETVPTRGYRFVAQPVPIAQPTNAPLATAGTAPRPRTRLRWIVSLLAVGLLSAGAVALVTVARRTVGARVADASGLAPRARTLAVLPFENLSGDEQQYLADGVTQAVTDTLSQLGGLTVVSTTSSRRYRDTALPSPDIARELGVQALFEGAVIRSGGKLRVSVAVVDGASGQRLWTRSYERDATDVLAIYDDLASSLVADTTLIVSGPRGRRGASRPLDADAYDDYLRAMYLLGNRWMAGGCQQAEPLLLKAVARDPELAQAHAALAWCYAYPDRLGRGVAEVGPKAKASVARALALDDGLPLAHSVAGTIAWRVDYDASAGQRELRRAVELDPNSPLVLVPLAEFALWRGDVGRGLPLLERAGALDPFSPDRATAVGFGLMTAGRYDEAIAHFRKALELDPRYLVARLWMAETYASLGQHDTAVDEYLTWLDGALKPDRAPSIRTTLQRAYSTGGWQAFWRAELGVAEEEVARPGSVWVQPYARYTGPWHRARRYARLQEWDRALDALDEAYAARHHLIATMPVDPLFVPLHDHPRFRDLLRKTGTSLPEDPGR